MVRSKKIDDSGECLSVSKERNERRWMSKSKRFDKSRIKCFICHTSHFIRDCLENKGNHDYVQIIVASDKDSYGSVGAIVVTILEIVQCCIMYSNYSYHMCTRKEYFEILKLG